MPLTVAVQMDPIQRIRIAGDSTFALMLEAQARGHRMLYYVPDDLSMREGRVVARVQPVEVRDIEGNHFTLGESARMDLSEADVVLMRQEPPFDMAYVTATHMLERIHPKTLVVNDPAEIRNAPEKIFVTRFPGVQPPTVITRDLDEIAAFRDRHGELCAIIGPELKRRGLMFVGVDVIGRHLTEINVTSQTGAQQLFRFTG